MILRAYYIFIAVLVAIFGAAFILTNTTFAQETTRVIVQFDGPVQASDKAFIHRLGGVVTQEYSLVPAMALEVPMQAIKGLENNPRVILVEEDMEAQAMVMTQVSDINNEYGETWSIANVNADAVHQKGNTGVGVKVGIIDSGINYNHPDLAANYKDGKNFVSKRGRPSSDPMDVYGHGTHVAGTACAAVNGFGAVGVAPSCDLYAIRVLNDSGVGRTSDILAGVEWAVAQGLDVINLSLGSTGNPGATAEAVYQAAYDAGVLIVAAAGNSGTSSITEVNTIWPANFDSVIAVAATDVNDERAYFSSTGPNVEIAAPGTEQQIVIDGITYISGGVFSDWNDSTSPHDPQPICFGSQGCYKDGSGTSMASPQVAGVAALVIATGLVNDENGSGGINDEIRTILQETATDLRGDGKDNVFGHGLVDAAAAVGSLAPSGPQAPVANAGADQSMNDINGDGFEWITLDASASSDVDGFIVKYEWDLDGDTITDVSGTTTTRSFSVFGSPHTVTLTATDNDGATSSDSVNITVLPNQTPTANAGGDQIVEDTDNSGSETVTLDGGASTDDGTLTYYWSEGGNEIATGVNPDVVLNLGTHLITLAVTDDAEVTNFDDVIITVVEPSAISLSLLGSKDKGKHVVTLSWDGVVSSNVDIYRDSGLLINTANYGSYVDITGNRGGRTYTYQVCEEGSTISCSPEQQISF